MDNQQVGISKNLLAEVDDFMLDKIRKGTVNEEDFREMARLRNNLILTAEGKYEEPDKKN